MTSNFSLYAVSDPLLYDTSNIYKVYRPSEMAVKKKRRNVGVPAHSSTASETSFTESCRSKSSQLVTDKDSVRKVISEVTFACLLSDLVHLFYVFRYRNNRKRHWPIRFEKHWLVFPSHEERNFQNTKRKLTDRARMEQKKKHVFSNVRPWKLRVRIWEIIAHVIEIYLNEFFVNFHFIETAKKRHFGSKAQFCL